MMNDLRQLFLRALFSGVVLLGAAQAQEAKPGSGVDPGRVDEAIRKGLAYLKTAESPAFTIGGSKIRNAD